MDRTESSQYSIHLKIISKTETDASVSVLLIITNAMALVSSDSELLQAEKTFCRTARAFAFGSVGFFIYL